MSGRATPPSAFDPVTAPEPELFDPFRLCVYTTVAVLAWLLTPAAVVMLLSGIALYAYYRARRAGLVKSRCKLGDTRLVMAYLGLAFVVGLGFTVYRISTLL
ncbi:MAG: hypothetical protein ACRDWS_06065 [Acidimicrobiia bacterium]